MANKAAFFRPSEVSDPLSHTGSTEPSLQQVNVSLTSLNSLMQKTRMNLLFKLSTTTHTPSVILADSNTGNAITQYPPQAVLAIAYQMSQLQSMR